MPRARRRSRMGGICSAGCRAVSLRRTARGTFGTRGRGGWRPSSRRRALLLEDLRNPLLEPLEAAALDRFAEPGPRDQHVVVLGRKIFLDPLEGLSQTALDPIALDGSAQLARDGQTEPRAGVVGRLAR